MRSRWIIPLTMANLCLLRLHKPAARRLHRPAGGRGAHNCHAPDGRAGRNASWEHSFYVDITPPEVKLLTPPDGTVVTGVLDIWGSVKDTSLLDWTLTATGSSGKVITIWTDTAGKNAEQLGVLDTGEFADGETIEIMLVAHDQADHESNACYGCNANHDL